jgi:hypothetical protein
MEYFERCLRREIVWKASIATRRTPIATKSRQQRVRE